MLTRLIKFITVVLWFVPLCLFGDTKDSLQTVWQDTSLPDTVRLEALYQLNKGAYQIGAVPKVDEGLVNELIDLARTHGSNKYEALGINLMGISYQNKGKLDSAAILYRKALDLAEASGDASLILKTRGNLANSQIYGGDLVGALESLRECEQLALATNDLGETALANIYNGYVVLYYNIDDWEKAKYYAEKVIEYTVGEAQNIPNFYNLGYVQTKLGEYEEAMESFNRSLNLCYKYEESGLLKAGSLIGLAKVHAQRNELDIALQYLRTSNEITKDEQMVLPLMSILIDELDIYVDNGMKEKGFRLAQKLYAYSDLIQIPIYRKKVTEVLFRYYRSKGEQQKALDLLDEYLESIKQLNKAEAEKEVLRTTLQTNFEKRELTDSLKQVRARAELQAEHQRQLYAKKRTRNIAFGIGLIIALLAVGLYSRIRTIGRMNRQIRKEHKKSDELLLNILPLNVAKELKELGHTEARYIEVATILFTDFVNFTAFSERIRAAELVEELNYFFSSFDKIVKQHGLEKIKTIGDAYMAAGGVPTPVSGSVKNTVTAALQMQATVEERKQFNQDRGFPVLEMRVGIHSGPVIAGVVGVSKFQYDIWGDTVNIAARMETACDPGKVNISQRTYELVKDASDIDFQPRGKISVKGIGEVMMYYVSKM